jgi:PAS domain S-box-containing protein
MTAQLVLATHFILLAMALFHPLAGALYGQLPGIQDPFWMRVVFAVICLGFSLLILAGRRFKRHHWFISRLVFILFTIHVLYLSWLNELNPIYFATIPIVIISAPIFFTRYYLLWPFLGFAILAVLLVGLNRAESDYLSFFFLLIGVSLPISFFNLFLFQRIIKKLQFSDYVLNNMDAIVLAANEEGEVTFVSKNIQKILGYNKQDILGKGWWNIRLSRSVTDDDLREFVNQMTEFADQPEGYDAQVITKSGQEKWFHWKIVRLGTLTVGVGQDISRRKQHGERIE